MLTLGMYSTPCMPRAQTFQTDAPVDIRFRQGHAGAEDFLAAFGGHTHSGKHRTICAQASHADPLVVGIQFQWAKHWRCHTEQKASGMPMKSAFGGQSFRVPLRENCVTL